MWYRLHLQQGMWRIFRKDVQYDKLHLFEYVRETITEK